MDVGSLMFPMSRPRRSLRAGISSFRRKVSDFDWRRLRTHWRKDGTELFYLAGDRNLMAVPIKSGATLEAGVPKSLFPITLTEMSRSFAVANDGQRFLVSISAGGEKALPMTVVLNWQAGLKK